MAQNYRNSCWKGCESHHTHLQVPTTSYRLPRVHNGTLVTLKMRSLHLWPALPVMKFSFELEDNLGHEATCPRFLSLAFSSANCHFLVCSQDRRSSNAQIRNFMNQTETHS